MIFLQFNREQPHQKAPSPPISPKAGIASPPLSLDEQADLNAFNAFNEKRELERINKYVKAVPLRVNARGLLFFTVPHRSISRWTRGTGGKPDPNAKKEPSYEKPVPAVLLRAFDAEGRHHCCSGY